MENSLTLNDVIDGIYEGKEFMFNASNNRQPEALGWWDQHLRSFSDVEKFIHDISNDYFYDIQIFMKVETLFTGLYPHLATNKNIFPYQGKIIDLAKFDEWAEKNLIEICDEICDVERKVSFKRGEIVDVLNGYGLLLKGLQIKGFDMKPSTHRPNAIVYVYDDSIWFAIETERIFKQPKNEKNS